MKEKKTTIWSRAAPVLRRWLVTYIEDMLLLCGGACFVAAAGLQFGLAAALAVAGLCLSVYAVVIARAKRGGDRK